MTLWGVDYASVDGNAPPNRAAFLAAGGRMVWQRASFCDYDAHHGAWRCMADPHLLRDWSGWRLPQVTRGAYWIVVPQATQSPVEQVNVFYHALLAAGGLVRGVDFPPCIDIEFPRGITGTGLSIPQLMTWIRTAIAEMRRLFGVAPMIYTSARVWDDTDADCLRSPPAPDLVDCPLWLARYAYKTRQPAVLPPPNGAPPVPSSWYYWVAWQDQGDALGVPGFSATTDVDEFHVARPGDRGGLVTYLQRKLAHLADPQRGPLNVTGVMDGPTVDAVRALQVARGLAPDAIVGPATGVAIMWL